MLSTPKAEVHITAELVKGLIASQIHELDHHSLRYLDSGWDNVMYRLGKDYIVRLPRRELGASLIKNEQTFLDHLPHSLPIDIPRTIFKGSPQDDYPWHWSVLPYFAGEAADNTVINNSEVNLLIEFLKCIHLPAFDTAPINDHRGVDLSNRASDVEIRLLTVKENLPNIYPTIKELWKSALAAKKLTADRWIHGDLHPKNVLVNNGKISAVIDWGDITSGDVATDLASIWMLFDDSFARKSTISSYGMDKDLLSRTIGWVIYFGAVFYQNGLVDNPRHLKIGEKALARLVEDFGNRI